ncbi:pilus assembly protein [Streptomyces kaniharaensis]|uniref:Pilus assembly protein n=2 Tax=Streptomyces kaniharaensis TaxID=212423 RepID=A0A6N7L2X2_9ACTN|nr:pilus assembly protein [Streptomyces kaniharaensis]
MAIVFPLVIVLTMLVVQVGLWYYAREIALSAASSGVAAGRGHQDSPDKGAARAREVLARTAGSSLLQADASVSSTADRITVRVTGHAPSLLPFLSGLSIDQSASAPREHWTAR